MARLVGTVCTSHIPAIGHAIAVRIADARQFAALGDAERVVLPGEAEDLVEAGCEPVKRRDRFGRIDTVDQEYLAMTRTHCDSAIRQYRKGPRFDDRILRQGNVDDRIVLALALFRSPAFANFLGAHGADSGNSN